MATFLDGRIAEGVAVFGAGRAALHGLRGAAAGRSHRGRPAATGWCSRAARGRAGRDDRGAATCPRAGRPEGQAYALWHRSEALSALGRADEAEADAREALRIARAIDHQGWTATAHRAAGIAHATAGDLDAAAAEFAASAEAAGESLTLFAAWAAARSALTAIAGGTVTGVDALVERASTIGPPLGRFEARLAAAELAAARDDPATPAIAAEALALAREAGEAVTTERLAKLAS